MKTEEKELQEEDLFLVSVDLKTMEVEIKETDWWQTPDENDNISFMLPESTTKEHFAQIIETLYQHRGDCVNGIFQRFEDVVVEKKRRKEAWRIEEERQEEEYVNEQTGQEEIYRIEREKEEMGKKMAKEIYNAIGEAAVELPVYAMNFLAIDDYGRLQDIRKLIHQKGFTDDDINIAKGYFHCAKFEDDDSLPF